jgi:hypothetical protein
MLIEVLEFGEIGLKSVMQLNYIKLWCCVNLTSAKFQSLILMHKCLMTNSFL